MSKYWTTEQKTAESKRSYVGTKKEKMYINGKWKYHC